MDTCAYTKLGEHAISIVEDGVMLLCVRMKWLEKQKTDYIAVVAGKDASYITETEKIKKAQIVHHKQGAFRAMPVWDWEMQGVIGYCMASMIRSGVKIGLKLPKKFFYLSDK